MTRNQPAGMSIYAVTVLTLAMSTETCPQIIPVLGRQSHARTAAQKRHARLKQFDIVPICDTMFA